MECALSLLENLLVQSGVSVGILGLPRSRFNILLREISIAADGSNNSSTRMNRSRSASRSSNVSRIKSSTEPTRNIYKNIVLPPKGLEDELLSEFRTESYPRRPCDEVQRKK